MKLHQDWTDFIAALVQNEVEFFVVGAFAVGFWGRPRSTGDLDVWIRPTSANAAAVLKALADFGFGVLPITAADLISGKVIQLGRVPLRIDILSSLSGLDAEETWRSRQLGSLGGQQVFFLGKEALLRNKRAAGRPKDLTDVVELEGRGGAPPGRS